MRWDVIIAGAGPVGLSLAIQLGMEGKTVLLLEKNKSLSKHSKAITIWPPTQEIFQKMDVLSEIEKEALHHPNIELYDADNLKPLIEFPLQQLRNSTAFPRLLILPQNKTEEILRKRLKDFENISLRFDAEVFATKNSDNEVEVKYRSSSSENSEITRFLIGCDGGNSKIRDLLDIPLKGKTFPFKAGLADIKLRSKQNFHSPRLSTAEELFIGFYIGDQTWRIIFLKKETIQHTIGEKLEKAVQLLFEEKDFCKIWESEFRFHSRAAESFGEKSIVLAGDAAHLNSPVGGQGMNAGVIDTKNLKIALLEALQNKSNTPIKIYAEKRKRSIKKGVNKNTGFMTSLLLQQKGNYAKFFIRSLKLLLKIPSIRRKFLLKMTMLS